MGFVSCQLEARGGLAVDDCRNSPLMTLPTPILVTKSPRPTELSNLGRGGKTIESASNKLKQTRICLRVVCILVALVVGLGGVLEEASVLNGDSLAGLGLSAGTLLVRGLGDTHCNCNCMCFSLRLASRGAGGKVRRCSEGGRNMTNLFDDLVE